MTSPTIIALLLLGLFLLGLSIGYIYSAESGRTQKEKTRTVITIVVMLVWVTAMAADILVTGYMISPLVHAIMGAVVGYFFADKGISVNLSGEQ